MNKGSWRKVHKPAHYETDDPSPIRKPTSLTRSAVSAVSGIRLGRWAMACASVAGTAPRYREPGSRCEGRIPGLTFGNYSEF